MARSAGDVDKQGVRAAAAYLATDFDGFYRCELPAVVAMLYALCGDRWVAEELAQDAFMRVYTRWDQISAYDSPGGFVRRVAINLARSRRRRVVAEAKALARHGRAERKVAALEAPDTAFWAAVQRLPRRQAEALVLRYVDDLAVADMAAIMGCNEATVRVHLSRGRTNLAVRLDGGDRSR